MLKTMTAAKHILSRWRNAGTFLVAFCWLFGALLGFSSALMVGHAFSPAIFNEFLNPIDLSHILSAALFPLLLCALGASLSQTWLICVIGLLKAYCFSFCTTGIYLSFGQGGWLVQIIWLFSACASIPVLYYFSIVSVCRIQEKIPASFWCCFVICCCIGLTDYFIIIPFLQQLLLK